MVYSDQWQRLLDLLLPTSCSLCHGATAQAQCLCPGCLEDLPRLLTYCEHCALALPAAGVCGNCQQHRPACDRVIALYHYRYPIDVLISALKYHQRLELARLFASQLAGCLADLSRQPDILLPVPLHQSRLRYRGFNQAWEITRRMARLSGIPASHRLLLRCRATLPQTGLDAATRQRNLRDAFVADSAVAGRVIALIDDVSTTGSTLQELATLLKQAGALRVYGLVVARAGGSF
jgi:ComF family protein